MHRAVKEYSKKNPYKVIPFDKNSKTKVSYMNEGDFFSNEKAVLIKSATTAKIEFVDNANNVHVMKEDIKLEKK